MGLFDFLKPKQETLELTEREMHAAFADFMQEQTTQATLAIKEVRRDLSYHLNKLKEYIALLEETGFSKITEREFHIVDGNKKQYLRSMTTFANNVILPDSLLDIHEYCSAFFQELEQTTEKTQKNYFVIKDYFGDPLSKINIKIGEIEKCFIRLKSILDQAHIETAQEIRELFQHIDDMRTKKSQLEEKKQEYQKELLLFEDNKQKIQAKIGHIKSSHDYQYYLGFIKEQEQTEEQLATIKQEIIQKFSEVEKAIKKFTKGKPEPFVQAYLDNSVQGLLRDTDLALEDILQKIRKDVEKNKLDLKDQKKENTLAALDIMTRDWLEKQQRALLETQEAITDIVRKIHKNASDFQLKEQQHWLTSLEENSVEQEKNIHLLEGKLDSLNTNLLLQQIAEKLSTLTKKNIKWKRSKHS